MKTSEEREAEREIRSMKRKYTILAIIFAIIGTIGFVIMIFGSSPPAWTTPVGEAIGIIGFLGTPISILNGGTLANQRPMIQNQNLMIQNQKIMIKNQERMIDSL